MKEERETHGLLLIADPDGAGSLPEVGRHAARAAAPQRPRGPVALPFRVFPLHYGRLLLKDIYLSERTDLLRSKREPPEACVSDPYEPVCS